MLESTYAKAFTNALERGGNPTELVQGLVAHLKQTGRIKLLPRIKKILEQANSRAKKNGALLEVARSEDVEEAERAVAELGITTTGTTINDSLIRGWRVRNKGTLIDHSAKNSLVELYRRITN